MSVATKSIDVKKNFRSCWTFEVRTRENLTLSKIGWIITKTKKTKQNRLVNCLEGKIGDPLIENVTINGLKTCAVIFWHMLEKQVYRTLEHLMSLQHRYETCSNIYHHLANNLISCLIYALKYRRQTRAPKKLWSHWDWHK